jgi:hypothetical protein
MIKNSQYHQLADTLMLIKPISFGFNPETAGSNVFQKNHDGAAGDEKEMARNEFDQYVSVIRKAGVNVIVFEDIAGSSLPDSVFADNWVSFHHDGTVVLYPMLSPLRRLEKRMDIISALEKEHGFQVKNIIDLTHYEPQGKFLEGTGSFVFDHINRIAYTALSERTHREPAEDLCARLGYEPVFFTARNANHEIIYHTNVIMSVGQGCSICCTESIHDQTERELLISKLRSGGNELIRVTHEQISQFAANVLFVMNSENNQVMISSQAAFNAYTPGQINIISQYAIPVYSDLDMIEHTGGGSARCMLAEIFLPGTVVA